jgi:hypothetical protein
VADPGSPSRNSGAVDHRPAARNSLPSSPVGAPQSRTRPYPCPGGPSPCLAALPSGWSIGGADITSGKVRLWLDSDRAGPRAITLTLTAACDTTGTHQIPSDRPGMRRFQHVASLTPRFSDVRFYTFPGCCATYRFNFGPGASPILADAASSALSFQPRAALVNFIRHTEGLALCGRGAACPR